jgi:hypothetical protein
MVAVILALVVELLAWELEVILIFLAVILLLIMRFLKLTFLPINKKEFTRDLRNKRKRRK